ncbi:energy-coupling factor ABC transporter ATP-binding protein [Poseidonibacter lekithochrous]|uniref:energy-coupling factor ABC transporter ATP-binding protein n=1 Tax=Poseidonibacter lekithochrous TaxID=1904463 RepID=UPI0009F9A120|nr:energy-coupling factor ABC transporter ATP-binding protein [Poseidonibacter lekithochrous]QKJ22610.1 tungsten ABC transporter TupABC, ATP-binding protein [Poseidonibacter lekithochrous]
MMNSLYELNNIEQHYDGRKVLNIENLRLDENQIIGFFGPNGSGKSTLFSLLSFVDKPSFGEISFNGLCNKKMDLETRQSVVMVPQNPYLLKRTVYENVSYGLKLRKQTDNLDAKVLEALALVGLDSSFSQRKWSQLSGGEAQRVALAARLILKPKVLILDEPTSGVDTNSAQLIKEAILCAKQKYNTTIFISSHDHNWLNHICDRRVALFQGNLVESGSVNLLFAPWEKNSEGNLVKVFMDGQRLVIPNSEEKKRDSVVMINSDDIIICRENCEHMKNENTLIGEVQSIRQQPSGNHLLIEFSVGGVSFSSRLTREEMQKQTLLPGDKIHVNIDTCGVCWI